MHKKKLTIDGQIEHMDSKGIKFEIISKDAAKSFLAHNNYYFKLKSYAKNFNQYPFGEKKGQYLHLDFAYIKELSILDMYLRKIILKMSLDIEHFLKTKMLYDLSINATEDGYNIVKMYLDYDFMREKRLYDKIGNSASSDLITKIKSGEEDFALWNIVEAMSFGDFIEIYQLYYSEYPSKNYGSFLWSIKFLRNAAAHNNCLLNTLRQPYNINIHKTKEIMTHLSKIKSISSGVKSKWMQNPAVHDFIVLLFVYFDLIESKDIRNSGKKELEWLFNDRMLEHKEYFSKNDTIKESYNYVARVIQYFGNKYR